MKALHRKKKTPLANQPNRLDVGNLLWAVGLILASKPHADDHEYLTSQHRSLVKALGMSMSPQAQPRSRYHFSPIELENMIVLIDDAVKDVAGARVKNAARKLRSQLCVLRSRYPRNHRLTKTDLKIV
jgi:hypothetical protein